jgi:peroxiredoxin
MSSSTADGHNRKQLGTERAVTESRIERDGIKAGSRAPGFTLPDLRGRMVSLEDYRNRRVLLVFSDPNCGPCDALAPDLVRLQQERPDLRLIMVSRGDRAANNEKSRFYGFNFPVVIQDGWKVSKEYGIFATPVAFLIDERGFVAKPVAIGSAQILALVQPGENEIVPRWRALWPIAAAFASGLFAAPLRALAQPTCPSGQVNCGGLCASLAFDPHNCGGCGKACPAGAVCQNGVCVVTCASGQVNCAGRCAEVARDAQNCGACGHACPTGFLCVEGVCVSPPCPAGQTKCAGVCANLANDANHCGACGNTCPPGAVCVQGVCVSLPCPAGQTKCAGVCANLANDPHHCGACGNTCPAGAVCVQGVCVSPPCPPGQVNCAGTCTNLKYDPQNCGSCGKKCPSGSVCYNGKCVKLCA